MSCEVVSNNPSIIYLKKEINDDEYIRDGAMDVLDLCDASTVVNVSLLKRDNNKIVTNCKHESESLLDDSTISNGSTAAQQEITQESTDQLVDHVVEIDDWLKCSLFEQLEGCDNFEETESFLTENWLDGDSSNLSLCLSKNIRRVKVFLLEVEPNPDNEPLDLIGGYCHEGCKRFSTYSTFVWSQEDNYDVPFCPNCAKADVNKELRLMFKFKLKVMDPNGVHIALNVWREQGEVFFGCSTEDFICKSSVREAAVAPLKQYTLSNTMGDDYTPLMDISLVCIEDFLFVVNSSLKKVNKSRKVEDLANSSEPTQTNKTISDSSS